MKKCFWIFICFTTVIIMTIVFTSCNDDKPFFIKKVKIKGKINNSKNGGSLATRSTDNPYTLGEATKVLIFFGRDYDLVNIKSDGSFSGNAPLGTATALAFLTDDNKFIGNLFSGDLNFLPLVSNSGDLSDINLDELILDGYKVIPSNNPIQNQIVLTNEEIEYMQQLGSYYEALSRNVDMSNDGELDILQHGRIDITFGTSCSGGRWGLSDTQQPIIEEQDSSEFGYSIFIEGPIDWISSSDNSLPTNSWLTGPEENSAINLNLDGEGYSNNSYFKVWFNSHSLGIDSFPTGTYTLHIDNKEFLFHCSFVSSDQYRVIPVVTLLTNSQNQVTNILFSYQFKDGTPVEPRNILASGIDINICGENGNFLEQIVTSLYSSIDYGYDYYDVKLEDPVNYSEITSIGCTYIDIFGNSISNGWHP
ncbi:MAG: hypothetical protein PHW83_13680 [Bacteroidales bacterium]|nr:hypothetical protein [Bacteroidales bacterium]